MNSQAIFSFLFSPVLFLLFLVYLNFKFKITIWKFILRAFVWGVLAVVFVIIANEIIRIWDLQNLKNIRRIVFYVIVVVAFSSELGKFIPLRFLCSRSKSFDSPLAGIIYGISIAIGFSLGAVVLYATGILGTGKMENMMLFLWIYPLANIVFGIVQGFFLGMGKVRKSTVIDDVTALGIPTIFHAFFYFCFFTSDLRMLVIIALGLFFVALILVVKALSIHPVETP